MELSKTLSCGWGGVLVVNEPKLAVKVRAHYVSVPEPKAGRVIRMALQAALSGLCYKPKLYFLGKYFVAVAFKLGIFSRSTPAEEFCGRVADDFVTKLGGPQAEIGTASVATVTINSQEMCEECEPPA